MSPSKKRKITKVDLQPYLQNDTVWIRAKDTAVHMEIGEDRCRTVIMDEETSLIMALSLLKQAKLVWGAPFVSKFLAQVELL